MKTSFHSNFNFLPESIVSFRNSYSRWLRFFEALSRRHIGIYYYVWCEELCKDNRKKSYFLYANELRGLQLANIKYVLLIFATQLSFGHFLLYLFHLFCNLFFFVFEVGKELETRQRKIIFYFQLQPILFERKKLCCMSAWKQRKQITKRFSAKKRANTKKRYESKSKVFQSLECREQHTVSRSWELFFRRIHCCSLSRGFIDIWEWPTASQHRI